MSLTLSHPVFRFATVSGQSVQWFLRPDRAATVRQLGAVVALLCLASLLIAAFFGLRGVGLVMPFAGLALLAAGAAFVLYARHAGDGERISLQGPELVVEWDNAGRHMRSAFQRDWVRVEPLLADGSLIELSGRGRRVQVGRYVQPELRAVLAQEIRMALRAD